MPVPNRFPLGLRYHLVCGSKYCILYCSDVTIIHKQSAAVDWTVDPRNWTTHCSKCKLPFPPNHWCRHILYLCFLFWRFNWKKYYWHGTSIRIFACSLFTPWWGTKTDLVNINLRPAWYNQNLCIIFETLNLKQNFCLMDEVQIHILVSPCQLSVTVNSVPPSGTKLTQNGWGWMTKPHYPGCLCPSWAGRSPCHSPWREMKSGNKQESLKLGVKWQNAWATSVGNIWYWTDEKYWA